MANATYIHIFNVILNNTVTKLVTISTKSFFSISEPYKLKPTLIPQRRKVGNGWKWIFIEIMLGRHLNFPEINGFILWYLKLISVAIPWKMEGKDAVKWWEWSLWIRDRYIPEDKKLFPYWDMEFWMTETVVRRRSSK